MEALYPNFNKLKYSFIGSFQEGIRHDSGMLADSGLLRDLEQHAFSTTREPMALYGDPAYPLRVHLQVCDVDLSLVRHNWRKRPFKTLPANPQHAKILRITISLINLEYIHDYYRIFNENEKKTTINF